MYCKNCGAVISDKAVFCPKCGQTVQRRKESDIRKKEIVFIISLCAIAVLLLILVMGSCSSRKKEEANRNENKLVQQETVVKSVKEQFEEAMELSEEDFAASKKMVEEIVRAHEKEPQTYLIFSQVLVEHDEIEGAKEILILGFEQTEDEELIEEYMNLSIKYVSDGNGETYLKLMELAKLYAQATGNEEKLELAKKVFKLVTK